MIGVGKQRRDWLFPLGLLVFAGALAAWLWSMWRWPYAQWRQEDLKVYWLAARSLRHGDGLLYADPFGPLRLPYIYPPFAALLFAVTAPFHFGVVRVGMLTASLLTLPLVVAASLRLLGRPWRGDRATTGTVLLLSGLLLWSAPVQWTLMWGQVNLLLLALVMVDLTLPAGSRWKGVGIGLATGIKLSPGLFLVLLLLTRQWRATARAAAVAAGSVLLPFALLPGASTRYWLHLGRITTLVDRRIGLMISNNQSLRGALVRLLGDTATAAAATSALSALLLATVLPLAAVAARRGGALGPLAAACACGALSVLVSPVAWVHHWVWLVPAFVLLVEATRRHAPRLLLPATAACWLLIAAWPLRDRNSDTGALHRQPYALLFLAPHAHHGEYRWSPAQTLIGDSLLLTGLLLCLAVAAHGLRLLRRPTPDAAPVGTLPRATGPTAGGGGRAGAGRGGGPT